MKIVKGQEMASIDNRTISELGVPGSVLMENAARALCRALVKEIGANEKPPIVVLCGSGNNGGDGFCIARILSGWGFPVTPVHIGRLQSLKPDARLNYELLEKFGLKVIPVNDDKDLEKFKVIVNDSVWIVDALFGTGLSRIILGIAAKVLAYCKGLKKRILAVDIPSGVNSDTGEVPGDALKADITVTFGLPKWGHFLFPGAGYVGKLIVADIGFPAFLLEDDSIVGNLATAEFVKNVLPRRPLDAHKGNCGKLALVAGCKHFMGAGILASRAALRSGTGYITLFPPNYMEPYIKLAIPDIVTHGLTDMDGGFITTQASDVVLESLTSFDALAIGPGLGGMATTRDFVIDVLEDSKLPAVIDADGLNHLASCKDLDRDAKVPWILTPHPGETARLLDTTVANVLSDTISAARALSNRYNAVVVMKGANTLIVSPEGDIFVNSTGNPGMATLGMGDVLTGIIASILSAKVQPFHAAIAGVYIHGLAGDIAASSIGEESITSSDVIESIPKALVMIRRGLVQEKISTLR